MEKKFIIIGAGAVGITLCARLKKIDHPCILVGRSPKIRQLQLGETEIYFNNISHHIPLNCTANIKTLSPKKKYILILAVKSYDVLSIIKDLTSLGWRDIPILCIQNGVDTESLVASHFSNTYSCVTHISCKITSNGNVLQTINHGIEIGNINGKYKNLTKEICDIFQIAGIPTYEEENIMAKKWLKLIINTTGAIMALLNISIEEAFFYDEIHNKIVSIANESASILKHLYQACKTPPTSFEILNIQKKIQSKELIKSSKEKLEIIRSNNMLSFPSIWQDLNLRKKKSEIRILNGKIEKIAKILGLQSPINSGLVNLIERAQKDALTPKEIASDISYMREFECLF